MNVRRLAAIAGTAALAAILAFHAGLAAAPDAKGGDAKAGDAKRDDAVRYAKAQLRLAELTLQKAVSLNRKVARTMSVAVMEHFNEQVELAKKHLEIVERKGSEDPFEDLILQSELDLRAAEARLKAAEKPRPAALSTVDKQDLERLRVAVEVAQLQLARSRALFDAPADEKLRWQLVTLNDSLARLRQQVLVISQNRLSEF